MIFVVNAQKTPWMLIETLVGGNTLVGGFATPWPPPRDTFRGLTEQGGRTGWWVERNSLPHIFRRIDKWSQEHYSTRYFHPESLNIEAARVVPKQATKTPGSFD